jgi:hypothetical protein
MGESGFFGHGRDVDAIRHDAQICYCGEPNCVGTIGGKTQTDIGGMGDLLIQGESSCGPCSVIPLINQLLVSQMMLNRWI